MDRQHAKAPRRRKDQGNTNDAEEKGCARMRAKNFSASLVPRWFNFFALASWRPGVVAVLLVLFLTPEAGSAQPESLSGAVPAASAGRLPSTRERYRALQEQIAKSRPQVEEARNRSDLLNAQAADLKRRLIATAARVQNLEAEDVRLAAEIVRLTNENVTLSADFQRRRVEVADLLAVLERVQHDMPPVMAIRADDALAGAHVSMLLGADLPRLYGAAADLSRKLHMLEGTRTDLIRRRGDAARNATMLAAARNDLDQLLATKSREAGEAAALYGDLASKIEVAAAQAADLDALLKRVAQLRAAASAQNMTVMAAPHQKLERNSLLRPVIGSMVQGDGEAAGAPRAPGVSFLTPSDAQVVAPADSRVLFAGPYHKTQRVLILQMAGGYDLVLAGLERVDVRTGDQLLAGEPVGRMPRDGADTRLYFELRENEKGVSPAPWLEVELRKATKS